MLTTYFSDYAVVSKALAAKQNNRSVSNKAVARTTLIIANINCSSVSKSQFTY